MNDILPSLFLMACGGYFWWTARNPDHAQPKLARAVAVVFLVMGFGALIFSLVKRFA